MKCKKTPEGCVYNIKFTKMNIGLETHNNILKCDCENCMEFKVIMKYK